MFLLQFIWADLHETNPNVASAYSYQYELYMRTDKLKIIEIYKSVVSFLVQLTDLTKRCCKDSASNLGWNTYFIIVFWLKVHYF